jgi:hypothetical protein
MSSSQSYKANSELKCRAHYQKRYCTIQYMTKAIHPSALLLQPSSTPNTKPEKWNWYLNTVKTLAAMVDPSFHSQNQNLLPEKVLQPPSHAVVAQTCSQECLVAAVGEHPLQEARRGSSP